MSFGLAGTLTRGLTVGDVVTAARLVDEAGEALWSGEPLDVAGARVVVACGAARVVDDPGERAALAERARAEILDLESGPLAASGRLVGILRVVSDTPAERLGRIARAATVRGDVDWVALAGAFALEPAQSARAAVRAQRALRRLHAVARFVEGPVRQTSIR